MPLLVCWSEATSRSIGSFCKLASKTRCPVVEFIDIGILQGILILSAGGAAADTQILNRLQKTMWLQEFLRAAVAKRVMISSALALRSLRGLSPIKTKTIVHGPIAAEPGAVACDIRILGKPRRAASVDAAPSR